MSPGYISFVFYQGNSCVAGYHELWYRKSGCLVWCSWQSIRVWWCASERRVQFSLQLISGNRSKMVSSFGGSQLYVKFAEFSETVLAFAVSTLRKWRLSLESSQRQFWCLLFRRYISIQFFILFLRSGRISLESSQRQFWSSLFPRYISISSRSSMHCL